MSPPANPPTERCHNCRRQRLRCDRSYPQCNKCINAGKECLGYGKLYRWTGAVASRGKLAGRTSSAPVDASVSPESAFVAAEPASSEAEGSEPVTPLNTRSQTSSDRGLVQVEEDVQLVPRPAMPLGWHDRPRFLADPLYQDMPHSSRHYLSYFATRLCRDLVSHDFPDRNPFRGLLALTGTHPLLQHIIVAASAAHMANSIRTPLAFLPRGLDDGASIGVELAAQRALKDSWIAKSKALTLMQVAVEDIEKTGGDVILAAALFFINIELIESGKHGWKAHLEGAGRIMSVLKPTMVADSTLRDYVLSDCFIYFILGGAFMPEASFDNESCFQPEQMPLILQRAAANSYLCCPPEILTIIHSASRLSNLTPEAAASEKVQEAAIALLREAQAFDINGWAHDLDNWACMQDVSIQSRTHAGSAHRLAACLYILQAIPSLKEMKYHDEVAEQLSRDIFGHLASVPDEDPNFKATSWPTFIAGAQSTDRAKQEWIMHRLQRLVVCCPWGFLYSAMDTLRQIWDLDKQGKKTKSWVQALKDPEMNVLIV